MSAAGSGYCVVVQFLTWWNGIWDFWCDLDEHLTRQGQQLLVLSPHARPTTARGPDVLPVPYGLGQFDPATWPADHHAPAWAAIGRAEAHFRTATQPPARRAGPFEMAAWMRICDAILTGLEPDVVLTWAPPYPQSRVLLAEAFRREVPALGVELGCVPGTLAIESRDVGFGSDLVTHPVVVSALEASAPHPATIAALRPAGPAGSLRDRAGEPATVLLLGSCPGFNLTPVESRWVRLASPWFGSFRDACLAVRAALPDHVRLVARPHQADAAAHTFLATSPAGIDVSARVAVAELIAASDAVAVLGSTRTQYEVLLAHVPLVLLSRSPVWGAGAAYEYDGQRLDTLLGAALGRVDWSPHAAAAERLLGFLAEHVLYGYGPTALPRGAGELAAFLRRFSLAGASTADRRTRLDRFVSRTTPLMASYLTREVDAGIRPAPDPRGYAAESLA